MEVKEFITQTIIQIVEGITEAQPRVNKLGGWINPCGFFEDNDHSGILGKFSGPDGRILPVFALEFDIQIVAEQGKATGGGLRVGVASVGLGGSKEVSKSDSQTNHIKFLIPIALPAQDTKAELEREEEDESS